ncbi:MAG: thioredoxin family protein [Archangium sp.]|nr:thioredoxin family protein [Archangium sp.]MDP3154723.1 thioredoxin family protein [Archangium sp.]MDP3573613.1 thioredoxin family protein [Archangium sp.]
MDSGRDAAWLVSAQVLGGYVPFPSRLADGQQVVDPTGARLDLILSTLQVGFGQGRGFGVDLQLPFGAITVTDVVAGSRGEVGLGDLEARARYAWRFGKVRLSGALGSAFPTGPSIARSGEAAVLETARYLTLGRGVFWGLADLDVRLTLPALFSLFASGTLRVGLNDTADGFRWGPELRGTGGLAFGPVVSGRLSFSLGLETQWRAQSSEVDPLSGGRLDSTNTGGVWLTLTPTAQVQIAGPVRAFVAARLPLTQALSGYQFIPGPGLFVGIGGAFEVIAPPAPRATAGAAGQLTLVEYGASWCAPCQKLEPLLAEFERAERRVLIKRIDASDWSAEAMEAALPGAAGLPVVEIFRADGSKLVRLVGEDVFKFNDVLTEELR